MSAIANIPVKRIDGSADTLENHQGKVLLVVNVASKCGLTPQYEGLESLYQANKDRGFEVLGFPANDFAGQEPGTDAEIANFCSSTYDVSFPMFAKIPVTGDNKHPLYTALTAAQPSATGDGGLREKLKGFGMTPNPEPELLWNFEKFLINRKGEVVARFQPDIAPTDPRLTAAIETELAKN